VAQWCATRSDVAPASSGEGQKAEGEEKEGVTIICGRTSGAPAAPFLTNINVIDLRRFFDMIKYMKKNFISAVINILILCIVVFAVSLYFIYDSQLIGPVILGLSLLCLASLIPFKISIHTIWADIVFGVIDNGILAILAIFGGQMAGVIGAIIGGVVGNAITDGIAGIFEGYVAEKMRNKNISDQRTMLGSAIGKMAGCLLGAGIVLIIASLLNF